MSHAPGTPSDPAPTRRPRRFISQFAELEFPREPSRRTAWILGALAVAVGLGLAIYDILGS